MVQIAFFTADWNYELVSETLEGINSFVEKNPDVIVRVFDCFGIDERSIEEGSVYEIYNQADLDKYDGAVIQTHQIVRKDALDPLLERIRAKGIPAVSIGAQLGNLPVIMTDDRQAFREIADHLIDRHHVRTAWFLKGAESYDRAGEAVARRTGFAEEWIRKGLRPEDLRFLDGNWETDSGDRAGHAVLAAEQKPDALVCANDEMALAAMSVLQDGGLRVPEDIAVTGYDDVFSASLSTPRLCTVNRAFPEMAVRSIEILLSMIRGEEVPPVVFSPYRAKMAGSCGCFRGGDAEDRRVRTRFFDQTRYLRRFYLTQDKMTGELFAAEDANEILTSVERYYRIFGAENVRIFLDEQYYRSMLAAEKGESLEPPEGKFSGRFVRAADAREKIAGKESSQILNTGDTQNRTGADGDPLTVYYPMRLDRTMIGVIMLTGRCKAADLNLHESIINMIALSLESTRRRMLMTHLNERLNRLYVTDQLTGLSNRFGLTREGSALFDRIRKENGTVRFLFLDIDGMKGINDSFGHKAGDRALRAAADILRGVCGSGDFKMRFGGDEFVAFGPADGRDLKAVTRSILENFNRSGTLPCPLNLSVGEFLLEPQQNLTLEDCLVRADEEMYQMKHTVPHPAAELPR